MQDYSLGLYLHIPYCLSKCAYCDFYSVRADDSCERYVNALLLHMDDYSENARCRTVDTVFIGGGTPTVLPKQSMLKIIRGAKSCFDVRDDAEFTIEANPATVETSELAKYRREGVNRISIGMQSACNAELRALSRIHSFEDFLDSFRAARKAGFENINVDVMYGIPEQTPDSLMATLETLCDMDPEHISLYGLKIEDNTPFAEMADRLALPDEDTEYKMYTDAVDYLASRGYRRYEISNFAKPGFECRHNLKYWHCDEYLGLGPGAHSYYNGRRFSFKRDLMAYIETLESPDRAFDITGENYEIGPSARIGEYVMLGMRLDRGIDTAEFERTFGVSFDKLFGEYVDKYVPGGFMKRNGSHVSFTTKGMYVSNYILSEMLDFRSDIISGIASGSDNC